VLLFFRHTKSNQLRFGQRILCRKPALPIRKFRKYFLTM